MPDRDKVMKGLELCTDRSGRLCVSCPYYLDDDCPEQLCADALAMLRDQETDIGNLNKTVQNLLNAYTEIKTTITQRGGDAMDVGGNYPLD